jgi:hypothetical protein
MKWFCSLSVLVTIAFVPCVVRADPTPMPLDQIGVGPHGYDFMIGRWRCTYTSNVDKYSGHMFIYAHRSSLNDAVELDWQSPFVQTVEYLQFDPSTATWFGTIALKSGQGVVSTSDAGSKSVWTGPATYAQGALYGTSTEARQLRPTDPTAAVHPVHPGPFFPQGHDLIRWTWTFASPRDLTNLLEEQIQGTWNPDGVAVCAKM